MKVSNINIQNKQIRFCDQKLELKNNGIYWIKGENGSGKTSLLEAILFNDDVEIEEEQSDDQIERSDKNKLFTYVAQNTEQYRTTVGKYIRKGNKYISEEKLTELFDYFYLNDINESSDFESLSGGEKHKLAIISGLLRETPYIFLDEPTNHLDDNSVKRLCKYLEKYASNHAVIVVSHDPRVYFEEYNSIKVQDNQVVQQAVEYQDKKLSKSKSNFLCKKDFISNIVIARINIICFVLCFVMCSCVIAFNDIAYDEGYDAEENTYAEDTIFAYCVDFEYGELNQLYTDAENISILSENKSVYINKNNVSQINTIDGVKEVIICDEENMMFRFMNIMEGNIVKKINIFNIPQDILSSYGEETGINDNFFGEVIEGNLPKDYNEEMCITEDIAREYFNLQFSEVKDIIGKKVTWNGEDYTISGILKNGYDICLISYNCKDNYGYTGIENINILKEENMLSNLLIKTEKGKEREILNKLISIYPAENYICNSYFKSVKKNGNTKFLVREVVPINLGISIVFSVIILICKKRQLKMDVSVIRDYSNYYINKKLVIALYKKITYVHILISLIAGVIYNCIYSSYSSVNWYMILVTCAVVYIPYIIYIRKRIEII